MTATTFSDSAKTRVVLDTNVCLDLFVFRDPRWMDLLDALRSRRIEAVTREDCRMEWLIVLDYPHLPVKDEDKLAIRAAFDDLITCLPNASVNTFGLPICSDPDDQKFLELALQSGAQTLLTKDKALLKLAKKTARRDMFAIMTPQTWHAQNKAAEATTN
ncbi:MULTISPECIES: putative toxin-antitoxin system toxin component, PIN family [unclassified Herbaspirillum]|uniref:putative toxin-antitoxin system toxin component, PIN family n=1 Tax=unclassified Herbaspirillum TaxID=2624150 RepID=UPI0016140640|nr:MULTISPECIES: putative toxin-antitoxin system toxin component, PIN family [unclassified Herbaspirillum]